MHIKWCSDKIWPDFLQVHGMLGAFFMFLIANNESVTHYLEIIYVAVERANLFSKVAWVHILYHYVL